MDNGLSFQNFDVTISNSRYVSLINHFIRECFGNEALKQSVKEYSNEQYSEVLQKVTIGSCCLPSTSGNIEELYDEEKEILLSFLRLKVLDLLNKTERVPLKDYFANHLVITAMLRADEGV
jgi:hypothetical protein